MVLDLDSSASPYGQVDAMPHGRNKQTFLKRKTSLAYSRFVLSSGRFPPTRRSSSWGCHFLWDDGDGIFLRYGASNRAEKNRWPTMSSFEGGNLLNAFSMCGRMKCVFFFFYDGDDVFGKPHFKNGMRGGKLDKRFFSVAVKKRTNIFSFALSCIARSFRWCDISFHGAKYCCEPKKCEIDTRPHKKGQETVRAHVCFVERVPSPFPMESGAHLRRARRRSHAAQSALVLLHGCRR